MLGKYRRAIVIVACIKGLDARIGLQRQRASYVRECHRILPGCTVVVRLARVHLIAQVGRTGGLATGSRPRRLVVPGGKESACLTDGKVRHPLGLGMVGIGVQLHWRAEGSPAVS